MTRRIFILALLAFILAGCSAQAPNKLPQTGEPRISATQPSNFPSGLPEGTPQAQPESTHEGSSSALPSASAQPATHTSVPTATEEKKSSPAATLVAAQDCALQAGEMITGTLETRLVRLPLNYRVYLPPCYEDRPEERYPVLYLFHGQSYTDDQWDRMGADETADRLIAAGEIPPLIIVMPYERYGGQPTETGFSDAFVKQLVPHIDGTLRTRAERLNRAVGGLSRGAGWAIHFGFAHWQMFVRVGAHSAAVFHTDAQRMRTWMGAIPPEEFPQVYLDIGDRDRPEIMRSTMWFEDLLNLYDIPHEWHLFSGYHAEEYWSAHMEDYLRWYTADW